MKVAVVIPLAIFAFLGGWFLNSEPAEIALPKASEVAVQTPVETARTKSITSSPSSAREQAEALYQHETTLSLAEKEALLRELHGPKGLDATIQERLIVLSLSPEEIATLIKANLENGSDTLPMTLLFERWAEIDLPAAFAEYRDYPQRISIRPLGYAVFNHWAFVDVNGALDALDELEGHERFARFNSLIFTLADANPARAFEVAMLEPSKASSNLFSKMFRRWAGEDPEAAWAAIDKLPKGAPYENAVRGYFSELAKRDRETAYAQSEAILDLKIRKSILNSIYSQWMKDDLEDALASLAETPNAIDYINSRQIQENPERILVWAQENLDGEDQDNMIAKTIRYMTENKQEDRVALLEALPYGAAYESVIRNLAYDWGRSEPEAALAWFSTLEDPEARDSGLSSILSSYMSKQPDLAWRYLLTQPANFQHEQIKRLAQILSQHQEPAQALLYADSLTEAKTQKEFIETVYESWSSKEPAAAFTHLGAENFAEMEGSQQNKLIRNWARYSPQEAADWLTNAPEATLPALTGEIAEQWMEHDPYEASIWIADLPVGEPRKQAVNELINETYRYDAASALDWSLDFSEPRDRENQASKVVRYWAKENPTYALEALQSSQLPPEQIKALVERYLTE